MTVWYRSKGWPYRHSGGSSLRRRHRGVSDVIGTILLLALTLTLFSSVFLFVSTFPKPSPQPSSQFQASLTYGGKTGTHIVSIQINHLTGPTLAQATTQFIFFSQNASAAFSAKNPFHISDGLSGASQWTVGQVWVLNLPTNSISLFAPDNITISIISSGQLLFHQSIPGTNPAVPPQFLSEGTSPANPAVGAAFTIFTQVQDSNSLTSVTVNITQIPGTLGNPALPGAPTCNAARTLCKMSFNAVSGLYQFAIPVGVTNAGGTFFAFITATDSAALTNSVVVPVNLGSSGSGSGGSSPFSVAVATNPASPVKGVATTLVATVTNTGSSSGGITVSFTAQGAAVGSGSTATIGAGSSVVVVDGTNWVPGAVGPTTVTATVAGIGTATATLAVTVFPQILLVAHSVASGGIGYGNTSAALETALTASGIPFTLSYVPCGTALTGSTFTGFGVAIIDYGSNTSVAGCFGSGIPSAEQTAITGATGTNFWVVGEKAFVATSCSSYSSSFEKLFGLTVSASGTCTATSASALTTVGYTSASASSLLGAGMPGGTPITVDVGFNGLASGFSNAAFKTISGNAYLSSASAIVGVWSTSGSQRGAALGADPAMVKLTTGSTTWGAGLGASLTFNIVGWLATISNSTSTGRVATDFAVSHSNFAGTVHTSPSTILVSIRSNGPTGGAMTVFLLVSGSPALFQGVFVSATVVLSGSGDSQIATLTWEAPAAGSYYISLVIYPSGDVVPNNNQLPVSPLNLPTTFT